MSPLATTTQLPLTLLLQGGIACGKSTVARLIARQAQDAVVLDCDAIAHEVLRAPGVAEEVARAFGAQVLDAAGGVDRKRLGPIVFADPAALARLEAIVHPRVGARVRAAVEAARTPHGAKRRVVVIDAPVAEKTSLVESYDVVVFVEASLESRRARAASRGWPKGELERREARQGPLDEKRSEADFVVHNDGDLAEAESHVKRLWSDVVEPRR